MAHRFRRVPVTSKVSTFESEVGGYQGLGTNGQSEHRAVIADAGYHRAPLPPAAQSLGPPPDALDQLLLRHLQTFGPFLSGL